MEEKPKKRHGCLIGCLGVVVIFLLIGIVGAMFGLGSDSSETVSDSSSKQAEESKSVESKTKKDEEKSASKSSKESSDSSAKVSRSNEIKIIKPTLVKYSMEGTDHPVYGYFFGYTNDKDEEVQITSFDIYISDSEGTIIDQPGATEFAPAVLQPGQTGFGVFSQLDSLEGKYPDDDLKIKIEANDSMPFDDPSPLTCSKTKIVEDAMGSSEKNGRGIDVTVKNNSDETASMVEVVCGLLDESGTLIGAAYSIGGDQKIPPDSSSVINCPYIVITPDINLDNVKTIKAFAKPLLTGE